MYLYWSKIGLPINIRRAGIQKCVGLLDHCIGLPDKCINSDDETSAIRVNLVDFRPVNR